MYLGAWSQICARINEEIMWTKFHYIILTELKRIINQKKKLSVLIRLRLILRMYYWFCYELKNGTNIWYVHILPTRKFKVLTSGSSQLTLRGASDGCKFLLRPISSSSIWRAASTIVENKFFPTLNPSLLMPVLRRCPCTYKISSSYKTCIYNCLFLF